MTQSLILALLVLSGKAEVWHLFVLASFSGCAAAFEAPVRQSFYTKLVPAENMANAIALNSATINISRFIGPTIGGILIAWVGEGWCFLINCVSFLAMLTALSMMRLQSFAYDSDQIGVLRSFREGVDYIRQTLPLKTLLIFMAALCFLGMPFLTITSALVKDILGGNSVQLGYVTSSFGAGALAAAFFLATRRSIAGLGKMLSLTGTMLGVALIVISFIHQTWAACLVSFLIGLTLIGSVSTTNTLVQTIVADNKRGRLMSFFTMAYAGMPPLGGLAYGFFAKTTSLSLSLLCAGAMCVIAAAIYEWRRPAVRAATDEYMLKQNSVSENNTVNTDIF
jgi:MFS family permease